MGTLELGGNTKPVPPVLGDLSFLTWSWRSPGLPALPCVHAGAWGTCRPTMGHGVVVRAAQGTGGSRGPGTLVLVRNSTGRVTWASSLQAQLRLVCRLAGPPLLDSWRGPSAF